jgi:two-component system response regulator FixJ
VAHPIIVGIVDDDDAVRQSLRFLLEVAGHEVAHYASGPAFLAECDLTRLSGLIVDQHMPQMTGLELVERLRANRKDLPVLLVTGSPSQDLVTRAAALGVEGVLDKPPSEQQVMNFVSSLTG